MGKISNRIMTKAYSANISRSLVEREKRYDYNTCECLGFVGIDNHFIKIEFMGRKIRDKFFSKISENEFISMRVMMAEKQIRAMKNLNEKTFDGEMKSLTVVISSNDADIKRLSLGDTPDEIKNIFDDTIQSQVDWLKEIIKTKKLEKVCGESLQTDSIVWMKPE